MLLNRNEAIRTSSLTDAETAGSSWETRYLKQQEVALFCRQVNVPGPRSRTLGPNANSQIRLAASLRDTGKSP